MKTKLFSILSIAVALSLASCGKPEPAKTVTGISIRQGSEIVMAEEEQVRLTAVLEPEGVDGIVTWSTSDSLVVIPQPNGVIVAQYEGEAVVTATCGEFSASIKVIVKPYYATIRFTGAMLHKIDTDNPITNDTIPLEVTFSSGEEGVINVMKFWSEVWVCSEGFFINESGDWDGGSQGTVLTVKCPMYYASKEMNPETGLSGLVSLGVYRITNFRSDTTAHIARPGIISSEEGYVDLMKKFCEQFNVYRQTKESADYSAAYDFVRDADTLIVNTRMMTLHYYTKEDGAPSDAYYLPSIADGIVDTAVFILNGDGVSKYMYSFDYFYAKASAFDYNWGMNMELNDANQYVINDNTIHFREIEYETGTRANAPRKPRLLPVKQISDMPMIEYAMQKQIQMQRAPRIAK